MIRTIALIAVMSLLAGCAGPKLSIIPEDYAGPKAVLADSVVYPGTGEKIQMFYAEKINGETIENSMRATRRASHRKGAYLHTKEWKRDVPVQPMRIRLVATHILGMPIQEIASRMAGSFFSVEGDVEFTPEQGKEYVVMGELKKEGSLVWIQTKDTKAVVTDKVTEKK